MKVLQLVTSRRPFFDQQVAVLERQGVECTVLAVPGEYRGDSPRTPIDYAHFYPQILSHVRSSRYDVVHANYGLVTPFALAQPTRPVVLTLWGTDLMSNRDWLRSLSRYGARLADAVVVPSPAMSRELEIDHEVIPFGVDTEVFRPVPKAQARDRVGWDQDRPIALFPYDGSREVKDFPRAQQIADRAAVDLEVRTVSGVSHDEIPYYMNASDLLLVTSERESGPMVVKEAAACELPIVSTDVGFVRETVAGLDNCVVSDDDDDLIAGVERIVAGGDRSNGRETIDDLSLEAMGERLLDLYRTVAETDDPVARQGEVSHGV